MWGQEVGELRTDAFSFRSETHTLAQFINEFRRRAARAKVLLFHQLRKYRFAYGADDFIVGDPAPKDIEERYAFCIGAGTERYLAEINPEALIEVDALACDDPFTQGDTSLTD